VTGQDAQTGGSSTVSPFQTIERQDVGLTLRIKPQVSEGGTVKLGIYQEVSSVDDSTTNVAGIITNKRAIESNVLVDDGQIIAIGGLIQDSVTGGVSKVPGLGDIPILGTLFRYDTRKRTKTNLMVFLRPYVIRTGAANSNLMMDRYQYMRAQQAQAQPGPHFLLPDMPAPQLPPPIPGLGDQVPASANGNHPVVPSATVPQDPAALQPDVETIDLYVMSSPTEYEARDAATKVTGAGLNATVTHDGDNWGVFTRVSRDKTTVDTTLASLRGLGFSPEVATRP
jgi:general secretion pathway protein D